MIRIDVTHGASNIVTLHYRTMQEAQTVVGKIEEAIKTLDTKYGYDLVLEGEGSKIIIAKGTVRAVCVVDMEASFRLGVDLGKFDVLKRHQANEELKEYQLSLGEKAGIL